jgi:predicted MFS family arabinose efflux permease
MGGVSVSTLAMSLACALAQTRLVELHPEQPEQILVRWMFMGALGDIGAPLVFALVQRAHGGWRSAFALCGASCLVHAFVVYRSAPREPNVGLPAVGEPSHDATRVPLWAAGRAALARPGLLAWAWATMMCALLDEILLVFGALHLHERLGFTAETSDLLLFALAAGSALGIAATDRLVARFQPRHMLLVSCSVCIGAYLIWLQLVQPLASAAALFVVGAAIGPQFPLAQAQCYRCTRAEPLLVNVLESMLEPVHVALPWLIGLLAQHFGLGWALAALLLQPLCLLVALLRSPTPC